MPILLRVVGYLCNDGRRQVLHVLWQRANLQNTSECWFLFFVSSVTAFALNAAVSFRRVLVCVFGTSPVSSLFHSPCFRRFVFADFLRRFSHFAVVLVFCRVARSPWRSCSANNRAKTISTPASNKFVFVFVLLQLYCRFCLPSCCCCTSACSAPPHNLQTSCASCLCLNVGSVCS